ncbi:sugar phosphate isomerase/epimerase [Ancylomarina sp. 16SWW S1-10-2]|uniref:sugar phosphate isomerase/epimerase family protein n=1 Tax=Ancylomarina sp. 16SWW S1-10-2 TaxID=2499681 RepID=UPI00189E2AFD|nr:sugar phosphate isomerase/epimerase [Ancylomarina sp. 16SWW S1-10-2]
MKKKIMDKWKQVVVCLILLTIQSVNAIAQNSYSISEQQDRLYQYAGTWVSSINADTDSIAKHPNLRMINTPKLGKQSLQVEVQQYRNGKYYPILVELIGYDHKTDKIFAAGHNESGEFFTGTGAFSSENKWFMQDSDLNGKKTMSVTFDFLNCTEVMVEGFDNANKSLWKTRYVKANSKAKNIGIQLVSVHDEMQKDPIGTLKLLGRMGYAFVETFVYDNGLFYGMSPTLFKEEVEKAGMKFLGSMTFHNLPLKGKWNESLKWWGKCISDHKKAGVAYLSTSNNQIKGIKTIADLQNFCDYYNAIGKLCADNGLQFVFHNHADEFLFVDGVRVYDYFLQHTDPDLVFFQTDFYWMNRGGANPVDYFKKYPNRFISWHVKDDKELGESGKINFDEIFEYQNKIALKYILAEVEDYNFPPLYSVSLAWDYINTYYQNKK